MKKKKKYTNLGYFFLSLIICLVILGLGIWEYNYQVQVRKQIAENVLMYQRDNMELQLQKNMKYTQAFAPLLEGAVPDLVGLQTAAAKMVNEHEEVRYIGVFEGTMALAAFPQNLFGGDAGKYLKDFPFVYSMRKAKGSFTVEGSVKLHRTQEAVFLFFKPIWKEGQYWGQVVIALQEDYVLKQLNLGALREHGYEHELWHIGIQSGGKEIVSVSDRNVDFSYGVRISSYLPAQWTLTIYPVDGWISQREMSRLIIDGIGCAALLVGLLLLCCKTQRQKKQSAKLLLLDEQTAFYNQIGFVKMLDEWLKGGCQSLTLFYFVINDYNRVSQLVPKLEKDAFLKRTADFMEEYAISKHLLGRVGECNFTLAINEALTKEEAQDIAKGLALEIFWRTRIGDEKVFLNTGYHFVQFPQDGNNAAELLQNVTEGYYNKVLQESPIHELTENCLKLLKSESKVVFGEYTDQEMMRLSKAINQYRKKAEQLAYRDSVLEIGNRLCCLRDANLMITYDERRAFMLYYIDICSFSRFNELFSVATGDAILKEVVRRLAGLFGNYLYRISGDVFAGLSLGDARPEERVVEQICSVLHEQIGIGELRFRLKVKIGICAYPLHAQTPEKLLEGVQIALHHAKQSGTMVSVVYNDALTDLLRRETQILKLLEKSLTFQTLEVWYQPIANMDTQTFTAAEALLRLKDEAGNYLPAGEVIAIAERNRMMDWVGGYVLQRACSVMKKLSGVAGFSRMAVNLSVQQLMVEGCVADILSQIRSSGVDCSQIVLGVTESVLIQSFEEADQILLQLQQTGINIALDDFGVGYSSLNYLSNLPVDILKIDQKLTRKIVHSPKQYALLKAIMEMARVNDIAVVAEGVESAEEQAMIAAAGVKLIQGYYYARPMPEAELVETLNRGFCLTEGTK